MTTAELSYPSTVSTSQLDKMNDIPRDKITLQSCSNEASIEIEKRGKKRYRQLTAEEETNMG